MKELKKEFIGIGEVRGYVFKQLHENGYGFISKCFDIYKVTIMWDLATPSDIFLQYFNKENMRLCGTLDYVKYIHQAQTFCNVLGIELKLEV